MAMKNIQNEITEIKGKLDTFNSRLYQVERSSDRHDQQIISLTDKLNKIEENTTWIKRTITGAIITGFATGAIGILFAALTQ
ncbi:protein xhlA [Priestia endophytica]|uniref:Protein xhlA n=2 Tax=Priestia endophytica TaxID=135735 RepID=A0AAX1Q689_9BACI|nr:protein xhlA [Priestia endophytica]